MARLLLISTAAPTHLMPQTADDDAVMTVTTGHTEGEYLLRRRSATD